MPMKLRKALGAVIMLAFLAFYALLVMTIAVAKIIDMPHWVQALYFLVTGILWAIPLFPLIRWMQKPDTPDPAQ